MLRELRITNFAIIDRAIVDLEPGLNIFTGETGAGKSILVEALGLVLGGRSSEEMIRSGSPEAIIEARFDITSVKSLSIWSENNGFAFDEEMIIRRIVSRSGRNKVFINGSMATVAQIKSAGSMLVDIHGQNEHQTLMDPESHILLLDRLLGLDSSRDEYRNTFEALEVSRRKLEKNLGKQKEMERNIDLYRYQADEIHTAGLVPDEEGQLEKEKARLTHAEKLIELSATILDGLDEGELSASAVMHKAKGLIDQMVGLDPSVANNSETLASALFALEEAVDGLRRYVDNIEHDPAKLTVVDDRIDLVNGLKRKYGDSIEEILSYEKNTREKLESLVFDQENIEQLREETEALQQLAMKKAKLLDEKRNKGANKFSESVHAQLADLSMEKAVLEPHFTYEQVARLNENGIGVMELMFSANPGEPPKPLAKIASGGEISRVMLALKAMMAGDQEKHSMIFDEIDSGVGGATADRLGRKLRKLATDSQVFCVTHLAQVARYADTHFHISKSEKDGRVVVSIRRLTSAEQVTEIARMAGGLDGGHADKSARKWAQEALAEAKRQ